MTDIVEVIVDGKFFYHGKLLSEDKEFVTIDDIKVGEIRISKNHKIIINKMNPAQKLRLLGKMEDISSQMKSKSFIEELNARIEKWQEKNREDWKRLFGKE